MIITAITGVLIAAVSSCAAS